METTNDRAGDADGHAVARLLGRNSPPTFYRGAGRIDAFRGTGGTTDPRPEDWVASTVTRFGDPAAGLTVLDGGSYLRDEVRARPAHWLGRGTGSTPELSVPLVKLLDAGQRLPVHVHPGDACARRLGVWPQGKAEAWFVLDGSPDARVHVGWARDVTSEELGRWVEEQDVDAMLGAMHAVHVAAGDSVYVPPGTAHAIGAGIFLVEVQQAADVSILLEWQGFFPDASGAFLGVEPTAALGCVDLDGLPVGTAEALVSRRAMDQGPGTDLLPPEAAQYFSAGVLTDGALLPAEYRTLVVLDGTGRLRPAAGGGPAVEVRRGATLAVPAAAGPLVLDGSGDLRVLAFGPGQGSGAGPDEGGETTRGG